MNTTIEDSHFTAPSLHAGGVGDYAILVNGVTGGTGLVIGQSGAYYTDLTDYNEIDNYCVGIRVNASNITIENNYIHDLLDGDLPSPSDPEQTGILVRGSSGTADCDLIIGNSNVTPDYYNKIENCVTGIYCKSHVNATIFSNEITSSLELDDTWFMDAGIKIETNCDEIDIEYNWIHNFDFYGIYQENINGSAINTLAYNTIDEDAIYTDAIHPYGIFVSETGVDNNLLVEGNSMHLLHTCIYVENVNNAEFFENDLHFKRYDIWTYAYGLRLLNCIDPTITGNLSEYDSPGVWTAFTRSFLLEDCDASMVSENHVANAYGGIVVKGTSADANFWCNQIEDCLHGFHFWNVGGAMGSPPIAGTIESGLTAGNPSDNYWIPEEANDQLYLNGSDLSEVTWLFQFDAAIEYNVASAYCFADLVSYLPTFSDPSLSISHCESSPYRLGVENSRDNDLAFNADYAEWAVNYNDGLIDESPLTWFRFYNFWNRVVQDSISINFLSHEVSELYNAVECSNVPNFINLTAAMSSRDYSTAGEITSEITPQNDLEYYWKLSIDIYINNLDTSGEFILSDDIESELWSIAILDVDLNGPGVAYARAMLDTIFPVNEPMVEEERLMKPLETIFITPNPADNWISITCYDSVFFNENFKSAGLIDMGGRVIKSFDKLSEDNSLYIGDMATGLYILDITMFDFKKTIKLIIQ